MSKLIISGRIANQRNITEPNFLLCFFKIVLEEFNKSRTVTFFGSKQTITFRDCYHHHQQQQKHSVASSLDIGIKSHYKYFLSVPRYCCCCYMATRSKCKWNLLLPGWMTEEYLLLFIGGWGSVGEALEKGNKHRRWIKRRLTRHGA